jgi:hypothetical protein
MDNSSIDLFCRERLSPALRSSPDLVCTEKFDPQDYSLECSGLTRAFHDVTLSGELFSST